MTFLKLEQRKFYDSIGVIYCKHLDVDVTFNAKGFHHLFYEGSGRARTKKEAASRLNLVPLVIPVIKNAEEFSTRRRTRQTSRKKDGQIKDVEYFALVALVGKKRDVLIKVILRKVGNGVIHFWSVMRLKKLGNKKHQLKS